MHDEAMRLAAVLLIAFISGCATPAVEPTSDLPAATPPSDGTPPPAAAGTASGGGAGPCADALAVEEWDVALSGGYEATQSETFPEGHTTQTRVSRAFDATASLGRPGPITPGRWLVSTGEVSGSMEVDDFMETTDPDGNVEEGTLTANGFLGGSGALLELTEKAGECQWTLTFHAIQDELRNGHEVPSQQTLDARAMGTMPASIEVTGTDDVIVYDRTSRPDDLPGFSAKGGFGWTEGAQGTGRLTYRIAPSSDITPLT